MPVRKVSNRGGNIIGYFPSLKMRHMIQFESLIERDFIYLLDFESSVLSFAEQPCTIEYNWDGKQLTYTPDFHLVFASGVNALVECKPKAFIELDANQRKFMIANDWCIERDWRFYIVTDDSLRSGYRLPNVKLLTHHARREINPSIKIRIATFLLSLSSPLTIAELAENISPKDPSIVIPAILHLTFHHELEMSLNDALITGESSVSLPNSKSEVENEFTAFLNRQGVPLAK